MIYTEIERKDISGKGNPHFESQGSEWLPLTSKILLREEPRWGWFHHNGLCL